MVGQKQGPAAAAPRRLKKLLPEWFLVMFFVCLEVWLGRTAADKPSCAAPQRRLGYTFCWPAQTRPDPSKSNSFSLCCDCGCIFSETIFKCVPVATPRKRVVPVWCLLQPHIK